MKLALTLGLCAGIASSFCAFSEEPRIETVAVKPAAVLIKGLPWAEPEAKELERLTAELRSELSADFTIKHVGPWVVATDLSELEARRFLDYTISQAAANVQRQLFSKNPRSKAVKVYLFKDKESYESNCLKIWKEKSTSPYGYFSRDKNALVMNIATGGGTLLHEMTHAMAEEDFSEIPAWLNEGLGSLFEACSTDRHGKAIGVTNWRLSGLQSDLAKSKEVHFKDLLAMDSDTFYGERSSSNYAAARYLMQWLQTNEKLEIFYTRIREKCDASALDSLRKVFDDKFSIEQIEKNCYDWAKTLKLPKY